MTSETWFGWTVCEVDRVTIGDSIREHVANWGPGHVEAFVRRREGRFIIESAEACPCTAPHFDASESLQRAVCDRLRF
jgi:hypothetical protein